MDCHDFLRSFLVLWYSRSTVSLEERRNVLDEPYRAGVFH